MPVAPAALPSAPAEPSPAGELDLAALLDLFEEDRTDQPVRPSPADRTAPAPHSRSPRLRAWTRECRRRVAGWGAVPGGAGRAW